jgi:hypothetical protein
MKELLSKKFWHDVKKTFDEARAETGPQSDDSPAAPPAGEKVDASPDAKIPEPPKGTQASE